LKPQNGIFIDLGNIIPVHFLLKCSADRLLHISEKCIVFLEPASVLLFSFCCVALFNVLIAYEPEGASISENLMGEHFSIKIENGPLNIEYLPGILNA